MNWRGRSRPSSHAIQIVVGSASRHPTRLRNISVHPKVVAERLGHATTRLTMDTYSHVLPGMQEEAAAKIERLFS